MSLTVDPRRMSSAERLDEVAEILAAGLSRLLAKQSSPLSADRGESSLDYTARESGHPKRPKEVSSGR
jgi:hypothetical protein